MARCKRCGESEYHTNHYADYTLGSTSYNGWDHPFEPEDAAPAPKSSPWSDDPGEGFRLKQAEKGVMPTESECTADTTRASAVSVTPATRDDKAGARVAGAHYLQEVRGDLDGPSCHVCGAIMVRADKRNRWECQSCGATTGVPDVAGGCRWCEGGNVPVEGQMSWNRVDYVRVHELDGYTSPCFNAPAPHPEGCVCISCLAKDFDKALAGTLCCEGGNFGEPHKCRKQPGEPVAQPGAGGLAAEVEPFITAARSERLIRAGALIAAEIDRLERRKAETREPQKP